MPNPMNPLIVQSDKSVLLEVDNPRYEEARDSLARFAELVKSPEYVHTYRVSPLSLWNAAAVGISAREVIDALEEFAKYPIPSNVSREIVEYMDRYGRITLFSEGEDMLLQFEEEDLAVEVAQNSKVQEYIVEQVDERTFLIDPIQRGFIKHALLELGHPVEDLAGYVEGEALPFEIRETTLEGSPFDLREYQKEAVATFYAGGGVRGGSGVVVLPCGAGKTMVGIGA
ncbi:MAG: helicase-associated domain-containing protein, partial [Candidatus Thorarchaeota archaeon]